MKNTLTKLRALVDMKGHLINALRKDLAAAAAKIDMLQDANEVLCRQNKQLIHRLDVIEDEQRLLLRDNQDLVKQLEEAQWWKAQDEEMAKQEAEERADEIKHHIEIELQNAEEAAALEMDEDIPF